MSEYIILTEYVQFPFNNKYFHSNSERKKAVQQSGPRCRPTSHFNMTARAGTGVDHAVFRTVFQSAPYRPSQFRIKVIEDRYSRATLAATVTCILILDFTRYFPLGGVNAQNMTDYLALDSVVAVGGSWIVKKELVASECSAVASPFRPLCLRAKGCRTNLSLFSLLPLLSLLSLLSIP